MFAIEERDPFPAITQGAPKITERNDARILRGKQGGIPVAGDNNAVPGLQHEARGEDVVDAVHGPSRHCDREGAVIQELYELRSRSALTGTGVVVQLRDPDGRQRRADGEGDLHEGAPWAEGLGTEGDSGPRGTSDRDGSTIRHPPGTALILGAARDTNPCAAYDFAVGIPVRRAVPHAGRSRPRRGDDPDAVRGAGGLIFQKHPVASSKGQTVQHKRCRGQLATGGSAARGIVSAGDVGSRRRHAHCRFLREAGRFGQGARLHHDGTIDRKRGGVERGPRPWSARQFIGLARVSAVGGVVDIAEAAGVGRRRRHDQFHKGAGGDCGVAQQGVGSISPGFRGIQKRVKPIVQELR